MTPLRLFPLLLGWLFLGAGCGHFEIAGASDPHRVLTGTVTAEPALPPGAEVTIRILTTAAPPPTRPAGSELPISVPAAPAPVERVLGEATVKVPLGTAGAPFRVEYVADDATLRRGLTVDVRVAVGGSVRYRTVQAHVITASSAGQPQQIAVQAVSR